MKVRLEGPEESEQWSGRQGMVWTTTKNQRNGRGLQEEQGLGRRMFENGWGMTGVLMETTHPGRWRGWAAQPPLSTRLGHGAGTKI